MHIVIKTWHVKLKKKSLALDVLIIKHVVFCNCLFLQKIKEEVTLPKTTKRGRESSAQEPEEPEKVTPKRAKTQVRHSWALKDPVCKIWRDL